ncbi:MULTISPECIES: LysR family transcriptional regulator [Alphaproteobacteria]|uniref:LysR family transcriptional regulator n=1 Tax=Pseudoroseicyclus aestuarii TaxID=1795041 RepID=A0A318SPA2_9RHOB|nr:MULTISPECIES: LysR family transcriptional regulator [Rhodobacterales]PYE82476.1 LysR family transcriptional regulator [Pseudoroseicyclus aestuarii]RYH00719.1 LysR family transcriptional regulator [Salipiger sp. IMCC34102]
MSVAPPFPRLPSLNALRAFEASARLGGFALAAEELRVTPGAVAAQIKNLESEVGAPLFKRNAQGVQLTEIGARALPGFVEAFDRLGEAVQALRQDAAPKRIHIATLPALAQLWLAPRLPALRTAMPGVELSVTAVETPPNLKRVPFDISLFYVDDRRDMSGRITDDEILPVCAPDLAPMMRTPDDLRTMTCLTDAIWADDWTTWAASALSGQAFAPRGPVFSLYAVAVEEALNGAGVLIARRALVARHLEAGTLVAPLGAGVRAPEAISAWALPGLDLTRHRELLKTLRDLR